MWATHAPSYVNTYFLSLAIQMFLTSKKPMIWIMLINDKSISENDYRILSGHIQFECGRYLGGQGLRCTTTTWQVIYMMLYKPMNKVRELIMNCAYIVLIEFLIILTCFRLSHIGGESV